MFVITFPNPSEPGTTEITGDNAVIPFPLTATVWAARMRRTFPTLTGTADSAARSPSLRDEHDTAMQAREITTGILRSTDYSFPLPSACPRPGACS